jgi:hypothetical protein
MSHTATSTPERSLAQRREALARANYVREYRAQLKRDLKAGRRTATALLLNPPPEVETMKAFDVFCSLPKHGRVKANKALNVVRVGMTKTIGGLSERQRVELAAHLGGR